MVLGGGFDLYKGLWWSDFEFFKYVGLLGAKRGVPENTVFFIQKFTKMNPLHDPADHRPTHIGLHFSQAHQHSASRISTWERIRSSLEWYIGRSDRLLFNVRKVRSTSRNCL